MFRRDDIMSVPQHHPGKVMDIYAGTDMSVVSAGASIQAMVKMWDGHTLVINVDSRLKSKLKVGDIILVDYYPSEKFKRPVPKILVTKILRGDKARKIAAEYKSYFKRTRRMKPQREGPAEQVHEGYIG
jgi:hypothetical protein